MGAKLSRSARIVVPVEAEVVEDPGARRSANGGVEQEASQPPEPAIEVEGRKSAVLGAAGAGWDVEELDVRLVLVSGLGRVLVSGHRDVAGLARGSAGAAEGQGVRVEPERAVSQPLAGSEARSVLEILGQAWVGLGLWSEDCHVWKRDGHESPKGFSVAPTCRKHEMVVWAKDWGIGLGYSRWRTIHRQMVELNAKRQLVSGARVIQ